MPEDGKQWDRNSRNNNPGNIAWSAKNAWQGKVERDIEIEEFFERFETMADGTRALIQLLLGKGYRGRGLNTIRKISHRYAPAGHGGNDPDSHAANAARAAGIDPDEELDWSPEQMKRLVWGLALAEGAEDHLAEWGFTQDLVSEVVGATMGEDIGAGDAGSFGIDPDENTDAGIGAGDAGSFGVGLDGSLPSAAPTGHSGEFSIDELKLEMLRDEQVTLPYDDFGGSGLPAGTVVNLLGFITEHGLNMRTHPHEMEELVRHSDWYRTTDKRQQDFDSAWWGGETERGLGPDGAQLTPGEWFDVLPANYVLDPQQEELIRDSKREVQRMVARFGLNLTTDQVNRIAFFAARNGMEGVRLRKWFADEWSEAEWGADVGDLYSDERLTDPGTLQSTAQSDLSAMAAKYMLPLGDLADGDNAWVKRMLEAEDPQTELSLIEDQMRRMAMENYPTIASYLKGGMTPQQFFSPYMNIASQLLERPVDFTGGDRTMVDAFASTADDKGTLRPMTWSEASEWVRGRDEWQYTRNAHKEYSDLVHEIGTMFGETT